VKYAVSTNWEHRNEHYDPTYNRNVCYITCATNQENNTYSAFVLSNRKIQKIITLVHQVFVEKEIHMYFAIKLEKPPRFEGDEPKHRVSKHLFFKSQQGNKQMFFLASFKNSFMNTFQNIHTSLL